MRILFFIDNLGGGGAQKLISDLVKNINTEYDCELLLLANKTDKYYTELMKHGNVIHVVPNECTSILKKIDYIWMVIKNGEYDLIHANLFPAIYYLAIVKMLHRKACPPIAMTEHSTDNMRRHKSYLRPVEKLIYSKYGKIICISEATKRNLVEWLKASSDDKRFEVIENGVPLEEFFNCETYSKVELFPELSKNDVLIAVVGSFTPQKNHKKLIEAMKLLPNSYKLVLVGEGPLQELVRLQVSELQLQNRVKFLGFRKDVAQIMKTVDIVCVPSTWEGFGLVAVEALAVGTPLAVSKVPGLSEIVAHYGEQFDQQDPHSISEGIKNALLRNRNSYVEAGKERSKQFDIFTMKMKYLNSLKQLL